MDPLCLVVPCHNEQHRLNVGAFTSFVAAHPQVAFCFVDDGSDDGTLEMLRALAAGREGNVLVVVSASNVGKAEAVRLGMLRAATWKPFAYIGYWDADLATPLDELLPMYELARSRPGCLMVLGSRIKRLGSSITRTATRHYPGRVFATAASMVLRLPVYDTQCGAKLMDASLVPSLFEQPFGSRWIFDVEILARLRNLVGREAFLERTAEAPLGAWCETGGSHVTWRASLRAPFELWAIERRYNRRRGNVA